MKVKFGAIAIRSLLAAGLALGIAAAHARDYNVTHDQEQLVQPGMTANSVRAVLGAPAAVQSYGHPSQHTWSYQVMNAPPAIPDGRTLFEIDIGANGRATAAHEFVETPHYVGD